MLQERDFYIFMMRKPSSLAVGGGIAIAAIFTTTLSVRHYAARRSAQTIAASGLFFRKTTTFGIGAFAYAARVTKRDNANSYIY